MANETVKRWLMLGSLLFVTLWLVWTTPEAEVNSELVVVNSIRTVKAVKKSDDATIIENIFALTPRLGNKGETVDVFGTKRQQKRKVKKPVVVKAKPTIKASTAPRLPFKYIGRLVEKDSTKLFLMEGETLYIVSQGDKIGKNYKVKQVGEQQVSLLYLPLNTTQTMSIGKTP